MTQNWHKISNLIIKYRIFLLLTVLIITGYMGYRASFVVMEYKYASMLPDSDSTAIDYKKFRDLFGDDTNIFVAGFEDNDLFQLDKFNDFLQLNSTLKSIDGVKNVASIATVFNINANRQIKQYELQEIFPEKINTQQELDSLKNILYSLPFYKGLLYNDTSNVFLMALTVKKEIINSKDRYPFVDKIENEFLKYGNKYNVKLRFSGLPYTRTRISAMIKSELLMFIFLAMGVSALILFLFFRSFRVVFFSMIIVGTAVVWSLGTMNMFGFNITILTGMIPPLLIVIGIPNCVFLLNKYHNEFSATKNKIKALKRMIYKMGSPIFLTNLTTAAGFATFIVTKNRILTEFGIIASLNIMGIFILSLLLIPIFFSYQPAPKERHTKHLDNKIVDKVINVFVTLAQKYRPIMYISVGVFVILAILGITKMHSTGYIIDDIPKEHPVYVDLKFFEKNFNGVMPFEIVIDTKKRNGATKLSTIKRLDKLQNKLKGYSELSRSISLADGIKFIRQAYYNGKESNYKIPSNSEKAFIFAYLPQKSTDKGKMDLLNSVIDSTNQKTRITLNVRDVGTTHMDELHLEIKAEIDSIFKPEKYNTTVTGSSIVFTRGTSHLIKNLFTSVLLAIAFISVFMAFMFSSFRMILVSLVPNILPLLFTAALMGYFGIAIKPSTVLVFSIAFGISVDNAIHFLAKYRQELNTHNWNIRNSVILALKETGVSILYTACILFFGFGIFSLSDFGGTVALGILVSVTLLMAMFANLVLLPSLLLTLEKGITTQAFKEPLLHIFDEEEDIELNKLEVKDENTSGQKGEQ